jgi:uncharacterized protein YdeI (YjbR/CyaY-like superfamily)
LRERVHAALPRTGEAIKWRMPAFVVDGRLFATVAAFTSHAAFGLRHPVAPPTNRESEAVGQWGRITRLGDLPDAPRFEQWVKEAAEHLSSAGSARRLSRAPKPGAEIPPALSAALAGDAMAAATFDRVPPGCRREYCEWIGEAKRPETRDRRVAQAIAWLREGRRRNWKYESC